jgi:hypothetical protein
MGHADDIEPVDRLVKTLVERNGKVRNDAEFLGIRNGHWAAFEIEGFTRM